MGTDATLILFRIGVEIVFAEISLLFLKKYQGESKVLQNFGNLRYNLTALDVFAKVVKVTNCIGLSLLFWLGAQS